MDEVNPARWQHRLRPLLHPAGKAYSLLMRCREAAYGRGLLEVWSPPVPCISVGNINWGGRGKTPLCAELLAWSLAKGLKPALLTRGYKASPPGLPYLVGPNSPPAHSGDEPLMLARQAPEALVVVDPKRSRAGRWVCSRHRPDLLILDDAFQHLAVARDLDLLLLSEDDLRHGWGRVLPEGTWREGPQAMYRASAVLIQDRPEAFPGNLELLRRLVGLGKPVFSFAPAGRGLRRVRDGRPEPTPGGPYLLATAVGTPGRVAETATELLGRPPAARLDFPDHQAFTRADWLRIQETARESGCDWVLCTAKDAVKLEPWAGEDLLCLDLELVFEPALTSEQGFWEWLERALERRRDS